MRCCAGTVVRGWFLWRKKLPANPPILNTWLRGIYYCLFRSWIQNHQDRQFRTVRESCTILRNHSADNCCAKEQHSIVETPCRYVSRRLQHLRSLPLLVNVLYRRWDRPNSRTVVRIQLICCGMFLRFHPPEITRRMFPQEMPWEHFVANGDCQQY